MPNQEQVLSLVRWLITMVGGYAIGREWLTSEQITLIAGAAIAIVPLAWSLFVHTQSNAVAVVAEIAKQPGSPVKAVITTSTVAGKELADSIPGPTVVAAGTAGAQAAAAAAKAK